MIQLCSDQITVFQSIIQQTNSAVITSSGSVLISDPAWLPAEIAEIANYSKPPAGRLPPRLLFTHGDFDHILGYGAFRGSNVIASNAFKDRTDKAAVIQEIREWDNKHYLDRPYPLEFPKVDMPINSDGRDFPFGKTRLLFLLAPGHNSDGIFTLVEEPGVFLSGDYLSDFELPIINFSYIEYCKTLRKAEQLINSGMVRLLVPGHGKVTQDRKEMARRLKVAFDYLAQLENAVRRKDDYTLRCLSEQFAYPSVFTKNCHENNIKIVREEISGTKKRI